ncbi:MAG: tripartite tricarboxylate transporter substrate binding protein [Burkholderiales bacterium]
MELSSRALAALVIIGAFAASASAADTYPTKPIRFIVPSAAGSGTDIIARILGQRLSERWHQPVIIDDRDGAGGVIGTELAARAPADGYTLYMGFTGPLAVSPALTNKLPYDPIRDFAPVSLIDASPVVLVVNPSVPANSVEELIALAKAKPGSLNFGSAGNGTIGHMSGELFKTMSGTHMAHIGYKSVSQAVTDVIGGQLQLLFHVAPAVVPHVKGGKLRALGVTSLKRWSILPELPTIAESGVPGYESTVWHGILVPARTPPQMVAKVHDEVARNIMKTPEVRAAFAAQWIEPLGTRPEDFAKFLKADIERSAKIVKDAGIRTE